MTTTQDLRSSISSPLVEDLDASGILTSIRTARVAEDAAAARQLSLAAGWADLHPPDSIDGAASFTIGGGLGREHEEPIAGPGCPLVAEFCVAELGSVLGITTTSAKKLIGHALELRHRLPRLWLQVHAGAVPAWRARLVAEATIHASPSLTVEAAGRVDSQVAAVAGRIGPAQLDRLLAETLKRFDLAAPDPAADPEDGWQHVDPRHATVDRDDVHYAGTLHVEADIDLADGLDLDRALAHGAAAQKALGSELSLDARRAKALGDLARTQTALDLFNQGHTAARDGDGLPAAREVVLHAHFDADLTADGQTVFGPTGRLENGQRLALLEQLRSWCADTRTKITIKPVIDLTKSLSAAGYEIPDRIREHVILRDGTCVFPWCTRPARGCDLDHITAYDHQADAEGRAQPGPTDTRNLAALCRFHHRLKTHTAWHYEMTEPGIFEWTSPPTATGSDETETAAAPSTHPTQSDLGSHAPADHDPAPHPATPPAGPQARLEQADHPELIRAPLSRANPVRDRVHVVPSGRARARPAFADPRQAVLYDAFDDALRPDLDAYMAITAEVDAQRVIDVGCGTGILAIRLAALGPRLLVSTRLEPPDGREAVVTRTVVAVDLPLVSFEGTTTIDGEIMHSASTLRFRERADIERDLREHGFEVVDVRDAPDRPGKEHVFLTRRS